jgi:hypothetical protein
MFNCLEQIVSLTIPHGGHPPIMPFYRELDSIMSPGEFVRGCATLLPRKVVIGRIRVLIMKKFNTLPFFLYIFHLLDEAVPSQDYEPTLHTKEFDTLGTNSKDAIAIIVFVAQMILNKVELSGEMHESFDSIRNFESIYSKRLKKSVIRYFTAGVSLESETELYAFMRNKAGIVAVDSDPEPDSESDSESEY